MNALAGLLLLAPLVALAAAPCHYSYPTSTGFPQLYNKASNGSPQGLLPALAWRMQQLSGCVLSPSELPMARRNAMLQQGKLQLVLLAIQNSELEPHLEFVPLLRLPLQITVLGSIKHTSANALLADPSVRIGVINGALFPAEVEQRLLPLQQAGRLEYSNDRDSLYRKLGHNRLQALLEATSWLGNPQATPQITLRYLPFQPAVYLTAGCYLSRSMPEANRNQLRAALQQMLRQHEIQPLVLQYLPQLRGHLRRP